MKKLAVLFFILISVAGLAACVHAAAGTDENGLTIQMELDKNYDDTDPFVNERLFCVTEDLDALIAAGTLQLDGESLILDIKNNKTDEVLWSQTWEGEVKAEPFSVSLANLKKEDEYAICLTGRNINDAALAITFEGNGVQERVRPLR